MQIKLLSKKYCRNQDNTYTQGALYQKVCFIYKSKTMEHLFQAIWSNLE